ncbi:MULTISPECIES: cupin domain-containing protein [Cupriavidus]|uniref:Cupin region n=1 Tax=Cupriavidus pinatubonensis (strain JMP 134 / LMG 1197) TaxID=264198 RepID=Q46TU1_CUPPJ|nr:MULTISPECIES: cupin domain-containing protein [Cupriavidus]QYY28818.1 cupin domain-containing protein [Cupriavidus pinatubonensis]TPQ37479.1 cupin domain-containing protein [Cupriavidus pinatubonensis]
MSLPHLSSGEVASVLPLGKQLTQTPSAALFKEHRLEVMRMVLPAGKQVGSHSVAGPSTIQCLEGEVEIGVDGAQRRLHQGDLLYLGAGAAHDVNAITNTSLLVTVVLVDRGGS